MRELDSDEHKSTLTEGTYARWWAAWALGLARVYLEMLPRNK
jgi:hypothetical protein